MQRPRSAFKLVSLLTSRPQAAARMGSNSTTIAPTTFGARRYLAYATSQRRLVALAATAAAAATQATEPVFASSSTSPRSVPEARMDDPTFLRVFKLAQTGSATATDMRSTILPLLARLTVFDRLGKEPDTAALSAALWKVVAGYNDWMLPVTAPSDQRVPSLGPHHYGILMFPASHTGDAGQGVVLGLFTDAPAMAKIIEINQVQPLAMPGANIFSVMLPTVTAASVEPERRVRYISINAGDPTSPPFMMAMDDLALQRLREAYASVYLRGLCKQSQFSLDRKEELRAMFDPKDPRVQWFLAVHMEDTPQGKLPSPILAPDSDPKYADKNIILCTGEDIAMALSGKKSLIGMPVPVHVIDNLAHHGYKLSLMYDYDPVTRTSEGVWPIEPHEYFAAVRK